jgi:hypothetical protein
MLTMCVNYRPKTVGTEIAAMWSGCDEISGLGVAVLCDGSEVEWECGHAD